MLCRAQGSEERVRQASHWEGARRGRKERMAFAASFTAAYHFRLLYASSATMYPIRGALRHVYGGPWDVSCSALACSPWRLMPDPSCDTDCISLRDSLCDFQKHCTRITWLAHGQPAAVT